MRTALKIVSSLKADTASSRPFFGRFTADLRLDRVVAFEAERGLHRRMLGSKPK